MANEQYFFRNQAQVPVQHAIFQANVNAAMAEAARAAQAQEQQRQQAFAWQLDEARQRAEQQRQDSINKRYEDMLAKQQEAADAREQKKFEDQVALLKGEEELKKAALETRSTQNTKLFQHYQDQIEELNKEHDKTINVSDDERAQWVKEAALQSGMDVGSFESLTRGKSKSDWMDILPQIDKKYVGALSNYDKIRQRNLGLREIRAQELQRQIINLENRVTPLLPYVNPDKLPKRANGESGQSTPGQAQDPIGAFLDRGKGGAPQAAPQEIVRRSAIPPMPSSTQQDILDKAEQAQAAVYGAGRGVARGAGQAPGAAAQMFGFIPGVGLANTLFNIPGRLSRAGENVAVGQYDKYTPTYARNAMNKYPYTTATGETVGQVAPALLTKRFFPAPTARPPVIPSQVPPQTPGFTMPFRGAPPPQQSVPPVDYNQMFGVRPPMTPGTVPNPVTAVVPYARPPVPAPVPTYQPPIIASEATPANIMQGGGQWAWTRSGQPYRVYTPSYEEQLALPEPGPMPPSQQYTPSYETLRWMLGLPPE